MCRASYGGLQPRLALLCSPCLSGPLESRAGPVEASRLLGDRHGDSKKVLLHRLGSGVCPADRLQVLRRELGRHGGLLGQLVGEDIPPPVQPRHPSLHRRRLVKMGLDLDSLDSPVSNQRPEDPPSMTVGFMLDPSDNGGVVDDHCGVTDSTQDYGGNRRQLRQRDRLLPIVQGARGRDLISPSGPRATKPQSHLLTLGSAECGPPEPSVASTMSGST